MQALHEGSGGALDEDQGVGHGYEEEAVGGDWECGEGPEDLAREGVEGGPVVTGSLRKAYEDPRFPDPPVLQWAPELRAGADWAESELEGDPWDFLSELGYTAQVMDPTTASSAGEEVRDFVRWWRDNGKKQGVIPETCKRGKDPHLYNVSSENPRLDGITVGPTSRWRGLAFGPG